MRIKSYHTRPRSVYEIGLITLLSLLMVPPTRGSRNQNWSVWDGWADGGSTYRRPKILANVLDCWHIQDYPASSRRLFILDDGGTFAAPSEATWELHAAGRRYPSLPAKCNALVGIANRWDPEAYVAMEDDDVYLPCYVSSHSAALEETEYSKPSVVLSDYPGHIVEESAEGRFHGSIGFRRSLCDRIGG